MTLRTVGLRLGLWTPDVAQRLLEFLTRHNVRVLERFDLPELYRSGVRYRTESREVWSDALATLARGAEDCDSLCTWRAAELRRQGIPANPVLIEAPDGGYHCLVRYRVRGREFRDDPSFRLGMRVPDEAAYRRDVLWES